MPERRHTTAIVTVMVFSALLSMFATILDINGVIRSCHAASCQTAAASYQSARFRAFGVGGVYVPADVTNWSFTYTVENGNTAGLQIVYFLFQRSTGF